jgi:hypothetical protein
MYTRTFQSTLLNDALARARAHAIKEDAAKITICGALADQRIRLSGRVWQYGQRVLVDHIEAPRDLRPEDLDWVNSRPHDAWLAWWDPPEDKWKDTPSWDIPKPEKLSFYVARLELNTDDLEQALAIDLEERPKRGPQSGKLATTIIKMRDDLGSGRHPIAGELYKVLEERYGVSRGTVRDARKTVLAEVKTHTKPELKLIKTRGKTTN